MRVFSLAVFPKIFGLLLLFNCVIASDVIINSFTITNNLSAAVANPGMFLNELKLMNPTGVAEFKLQETDCPFGDISKYLKPKGQVGDSCYVKYKTLIPEVVGNFLNQFNVSDALGGNTLSSVFGVSVFPKGKLGHLVFEENGNPLSVLSLTANDKGVVVLKNTGGMTITDVAVSNLAHMDFTNVDCPSSNGTLMPKGSCHFSYHISGTPLTKSFLVSVSGTNVDNTPTLEVAVAPRIYITNNYNNRYYVSVCNVDKNTGALLQCKDSGLTELSHPFGLTLNHTDTRAYIANWADNKVWQCDINPVTGLFSHCKGSKGAGFAGPMDIKLNSTDTRAYITNYRDDRYYVSVCNVDKNTGVLLQCKDSEGTGFAKPFDLTLNHTDTRAYITNFGPDKIWQCNISPITGLFSHCKDSKGAGFYGPRDIILNSTDTRAYITNNYAMVATMFLFATLIKIPERSCSVKIVRGQDLLSLMVLRLITRTLELILQTIVLIRFGNVT